MDAFVALTQSDEGNIIASMFANRMKVKKTITQIKHEDLFGKWKNNKNKGNLTDFDGEKFYQAEIVEMPFMATLLCVFGIFFCLWKMDATWTCVFPAGAGICMLIGLFTSRMLQTGEGWLVLVITSALMILAAAYLLIQWFTSIYKWFTVKKRHY